jgi:SOS-response transcriptional repressor LexA
MNQMSGGRRPGFTRKQGQYLAFIDAYTRLHRRPPAEREMQRHFGVTPPSVHQMILTLERAGFIRRQPGVPRSIEVLVPPEDLPVLQHPIRQNLCDEVLVSDMTGFPAPSVP